MVERNIFIVDFFYYYEGGYSQRNLKEFITGRESSELYMTNRIDFTMRGEKERSGEGERRTRKGERKRETREEVKTKRLQPKS